MVCHEYNFCHYLLEFAVFASVGLYLKTSQFKVSGVVWALIPMVSKKELNVATILKSLNWLLIKQNYLLSWFVIDLTTNLIYSIIKKLLQTENSKLMRLSVCMNIYCHNNVLLNINMTIAIFIYLNLICNEQMKIFFIPTSEHSISS